MSTLHVSLPGYCTFFNQMGFNVELPRRLTITKQSQMYPKIQFSIRVNNVLKLIVYTKYRQVCDVEFTFNKLGLYKKIPSLKGSVREILFQYREKFCLLSLVYPRYILNQTAESSKYCQPLYESYPKQYQSERMLLLYEKMHI